jgi:hypothetical protein
MNYNELRDTDRIIIRFRAVLNRGPSCSADVPLHTPPSSAAGEENYFVG